MYLTLWTLRVSPLYVCRHFTLCFSPALDSIYYTSHVLDSMFIVTLCLSSIIIYVLLSMASYRRTRLRRNPKSSNFTSRSCARPRQSPQRVAREPCGKPKGRSFTSRSYTRPRRFPQRVVREPCGNPNSCSFTSRSRARPRESTQRVARGDQKLQPRVRVLDHANPRKGLRGALKSCNFTSRSRARPRQSMQRVAFPIDGNGAGSGFRKKARYTEM